MGSPITYIGSPSLLFFILDRSRTPLDVIITNLMFSSLVRELAKFDFDITLENIISQMKLSIFPIIDLIFLPVAIVELVITIYSHINRRINVNGKIY